MAVYSPAQGDIVMMNFSPQAGHEPGGPPSCTGHQQ